MAAILHRTDFVQAEIIDKICVYCAHIIREVVRISGTPLHFQPAGQSNTWLCIFCPHLPLVKSSTVYPVGKGKIKVKVTLAQVTKVQRGSRGTAPLFL